MSQLGVTFSEFFLFQQSHFHTQLPPSPPHTIQSTEVKGIAAAFSSLCYCTMLKLMFARHDMARRKGSVNYKNAVLIKIVKRHPSKNREMGGAATLGGRRFVNRHNNQPKVGCDGGWGRWWWDARGAECMVGFFSCHIGQRMGRRKKKREWPGLDLKRLPLDQPMQQPTKNSTNDGEGILDDIWPWWNVGGGRLPVILDGNLFHDK